MYINIYDYIYDNMLDVIDDRYICYQKCRSCTLVLLLILNLAPRYYFIMSYLAMFLANTVSTSFYTATLAFY